MAEGLFALLVGGGLLAAIAGASRAPAGVPPLPPGPRPPPAPPPSPGGTVTPGGAGLLAALTPETQVFALQVTTRAAAEGIGLTLTSGKRSCAEQNRLYAQGRTAPGPVVTGAKGCLSWHVQGCAFDFKPTPATDTNYRRVGAIAKALGGRWGGDFPNFYDPGHLENHPGKTIEQVCPKPEDCT